MKSYFYSDTVHPLFLSFSVLQISVTLVTRCPLLVCECELWRVGCSLLEIAPLILSEVTLTSEHAFTDCQHLYMTWSDGSAWLLKVHFNNNQCAMYCLAWSLLLDRDVTMLQNLSLNNLCFYFVKYLLCCKRLTSSLVLPGPFSVVFQLLSQLTVL